jgi:hypothetical protein
MSNLETFRELYVKNATQYSQTLGKYSQAVLKCIDKAIRNNNQPDENGVITLKS